MNKNIIKLLPEDTERTSRRYLGAEQMTPAFEEGYKNIKGRKESIQPGLVSCIFNCHLYKILSGILPWKDFKLA